MVWQYGVRLGARQTGGCGGEHWRQCGSVERPGAPALYRQQQMSQHIEPALVARAGVIAWGALLAVLISQTFRGGPGQSTADALSAATTARYGLT